MADGPARAAGFAGDPVRSADHDGLRLHVSRFRAGERVARHGHDEPYVCLALGGPFRERVGARTWTEGPLTVISHPAGEEHDDAFDGDAVCVNLAYSPAWIERHGVAARLWTERRASPHGALVALGLRLFRLHASGGDASGLEWDELACAFVGEHGTAAAAPPARLAWIAEAIEDDPTATPGLTELARRVQLHPVYVARAFRRAYGSSIGEYLRHARVRRAMRLLATTEMPICDVAAESGFVDQSHMTRLLKRVTGSTPAALRAHVRGHRRAAAGRFAASKTARA